MTVNDLFVLLVVTTAVRVFLPDIVVGLRRLLRAGARVGVAELLGAQPARTEATATTAATEALVAVPARDEEA